MKKVRSILILAVLLVGICCNVSAKEDGWVKLAEKNVAFKADKDNVSITGKEKNVSKIKVTCIQGVVKIKKIHVKMSDGKTKTINPAAGILKEGMSTLAFDLPGSNNELKDLDIEYDSAGTIVTNKRAKVEIWGKQRKEK